MSPSVAHRAPTQQTRTVCLGCLGTKHCWACSGTGHAAPHAGEGVCAECSGNRLCTYCPPVPAPRSSSSG